MININFGKLAKVYGPNTMKAALDVYEREIGHEPRKDEVLVSGSVGTKIMRVFFRATYSFAK